MIVRWCFFSAATPDHPFAASLARCKRWAVLRTPRIYRKGTGTEHERLLDSGIEYSLAELPHTGEALHMPWPGSLWPTWRDSINDRWDGPESLSASEKYGSSKAEDWEAPTVDCDESKEILEERLTKKQETLTKMLDESKQLNQNHGVLVQKETAFEKEERLLIELTEKADGHERLLSAWEQLKEQHAEQQAEVENELITVPNGRHGGFPANEMLRIYDAVFKFLDKNVPN